MHQGSFKEITKLSKHCLISLCNFGQRHRLRDYLFHFVVVLVVAAASISLQLFVLPAQVNDRCFKPEARYKILIVFDCFKQCSYCPYVTSRRSG